MPFRVFFRRGGDLLLALLGGVGMAALAYAMMTRNAPDGTAVERVEIWTTDADNPAVLLVRSRLGQAEVLEKADPGAAGIVVVVGDLFEETFEGRPSIKTDDDGVI